MAHKMQPIPFKNLLTWIFNELRLQNSIFGITANKIFKKKNFHYFKFTDYLIETPFGPAAGPHTQLSQNIITSYIVGGRFIELKTVQILDELEIDKPCIEVADEGYNVEWSQELTLDQSFDEYLKAWIIIHLLKKIFSISHNDSDGFIFNMSVGYNLEGIQSKKVDDFIEKIKNANNTKLFDQYLKETLKFFNENSNIEKYLTKGELEKLISNIKPQISDNVTLSTMHGCPSAEIEEIARYLISKKNLNTFVKLNPTLLGYERVREILDKLGYTYITLKKESFDHDLKFDEAIPMIKRLASFANQHNKIFGIKLSNTLGVVNTRNLLPGNEMYMSGRALFPLTINLAYEITKAIREDLPISYSGGANILNATKIVDTGIYPVTFATDLLKPGGYLRLHQIVNDFEEKFERSIKQHKIDLQKLEAICEEALNHPYYKKNFKEIEKVNIEKTLPLYDCYIAPCEITCPINQDVSEYVYLISERKFEDALEVITEKNPLPHITGYICDHKCMTKCNRWDYDYPVLIRDLKKFAAEKAFENYLKKFKSISKENKNGIKIAVIGAGPAGLSASYFLARAGFDVTIFEKTDKAGGTVRHTIPQFRIPQEIIDKDIEFIQMHGVNVIFNSSPYLTIVDLKAHGYKYIFIGIGAEIPNEIKLNSNNQNVFDALDFLKRFNKNEKFEFGKNVVVVGGGNSAMDAARAAIRIDGVESVSLVYRRTFEYMPADKEEIEAAIKDGVKFLELLQPIEFVGKILKCQKMKLGELDVDGRRKSIPIENDFVEIEADTVITAIGEKTDYEFLKINRIPIDERKKVITNPETNETLIENVFIGGDTLRGPSTVIQAIADGKKAAETIIRRENIHVNFDLKRNYKSEMMKKVEIVRGNLDFNFSTDPINSSTKCLLCDVVCNKCVDVCPNRANIAISVNDEIFKDRYQIIHINELCNECGNCETFCPYFGKPYKNKFTFFSNFIEFERSTNPGFVFTTEKTIQFRLEDGNVHEFNFIDEKDLIAKIDRLKLNSNGSLKFFSTLKTILSNYSYIIY